MTGGNVRSHATRQARITIRWPKATCPLPDATAGPLRRTCALRPQHATTRNAVTREPVARTSPAAAADDSLSPTGRPLHACGGRRGGGGMLSFPKRQTRRTRRLGRRARDGARRTGLPPGLTSHWERPLSVVHPSSPHFLSFPAAATTEASAGGGTPRLSAIAPRPDGAPACIAAVRRSGVIAAASAHVACASASWRLPTRASA